VTLQKYKKNKHDNIFARIFFLKCFYFKINFQKLPASNLTLENIMNFHWNTHTVCERADAEIWDFLLTFPHVGRGSELPEDDQKKIAEEASKHGLSIKQCMSLRRNILRAVYGPGPFARNMKMGDEKTGALYAQQFEYIVAQKLTAMQVSFVREQEQKQLQKSGKMEKHGTPDFFFIDPITINNHVIHWIEAKTPMGSLALAEFDSKHKIPMQQALKQMQQYINYGPGAIIFLNGFVPDLQSYVKSNIGDILLLDASELDLTSLDAI